MIVSEKILLTFYLRFFKLHLSLSVFGCYVFTKRELIESDSTFYSGANKAWIKGKFTLQLLIIQQEFFSFLMLSGTPPIFLSVHFANTCMYLLKRGKFQNLEITGQIMPVFPVAARQGRQGRQCLPWKNWLLVFVLISVNFKYILKIQQITLWNTVIY